MTVSNARSAEHFSEAKRLFPGGVNSPVRAFRAVGCEPLVLTHGRGALVYDADGNEYIDYVAAWGPLSVGHAHPSVVSAIQEQAARGTGFGAPSELETELARRIASAVPVVEKLRLTTSGTEAVMSALRLARALTGREKVLKFAGGYHGHADSLLVKAGSGAATLGLPDSPGVTRGAAGDTLLAAYNDLDSVRAALLSAPGEVAAILVEPVAGNMGLVLPEDGFLQGLRSLADDHGALLIFDEVMSGFRVARGGAVERFGVRPDLITLGKIIGGGLPVGAYGGSAEAMDMVAPAGPVYQAGTMAGNPIVAAAGIATLDALLAPGEWERAAAFAKDLAAGLAAAAQAARVALQTAVCGTMVGAFFNRAPVRDYEAALDSDTGAYARWFGAMLDRGVYLAPSQFETLFVSTAHGPDHLSATLAAADEAMAMVLEWQPPLC